MIGLMVLIFFAFYLGISIFAISKASTWAKDNNKKPWLWGGLAAFVMYNLVFWDLIPTLVMHKYYCSTQAGFWIYKTPEQWVKDNPELSKADFRPYLESDEDKYTTLYPGTPDAIAVTKINKRIFNAFITEEFTGLIPMRKNVDYFYDSESGEKIAELIDYSSGYGNPMTTGKGLSAWKFWLRDNCYGTQADKWKLTGYKEYLQKIIQLGE